MKWNIDGKDYVIQPKDNLAVRIVRDGRTDRTYTFRGSDVKRAVFIYRCINIGNGYGKRLMVNRNVIVRADS